MTKPTGTKAYYSALAKKYGDTVDFAHNGDLIYDKEVFQSLSDENQQAYMDELSQILKNLATSGKYSLIDVENYATKVKTMLYGESECDE